MAIDLVPVWTAILAFAVFMYVLLDGFDLGVGILFPFAPDDASRSLMMNSVAPIWDGNETWLILGGLGLFAAFPLAFAIIMPALYYSILLMLLGLIFRGIAFEFRMNAQTSRPWWDRAFFWGSLIATLSQGIVLGAFIQGFEVSGRQFAGSTFDWMHPFPLAVGMGLVFGYGLLGAAWLVMKTEDSLQRWARGKARVCFLGVLVFIAFSPRVHFDEKEGLYVGGQFLDGRAATLEEQAEGPLLNPLEMANPDKQAVVEKVRRAAYAPQFDSVFGKGALDDTELAYARIAEAVAAFERTPQFSPFSSKYDAWLAGKAKLTQQEMRGLRLFEAEDKGNCAACHPSKPGPKGEPPLFTDFTYDNLGVPRNPDNPFYILPAPFNPAGAQWVDRGLGATVNKPSEDGKFKVPTLRNIELTGPYMHNGYFRTLSWLPLSPPVPSLPSSFRSYNAIKPRPRPVMGGIQRH